MYTLFSRVVQFFFDTLISVVVRIIFQWSILRSKLAEKYLTLWPLFSTWVESCVFSPWSGKSRTLVVPLANLKLTLCGVVLLTLSSVSSYVLRYYDGTPVCSTVCCVWPLPSLPRRRHLLHQTQKQCREVRLLLRRHSSTIHLFHRSTVHVVQSPQLPELFSPLK